MNNFHGLITLETARLATFDEMVDTSMADMLSNIYS